MVPNMQRKGLTYQFKVTLKGIVPQVWRRIVVPANYSFWDLHVAIQDSMGWLDYHLHAFRVRDSRSGAEVEIGIPDPDGFGERPCLPGWEVPVADYFAKAGDVADYEYDFGDGWEHEVALEDVVPRSPKARYPICLDGAQACPPEDCGGIPGYEEMLAVLSDPTHEEYEQTREWVGGRYDPSEFDKSKVRFDNPRKRWKMAFQSE
jgi:hypothetical protein